MNSTQTISHLCDSGKLHISKAWLYHKGSDKFGYYMQFTNDGGSVSAFGVGFQLTVFKLYAKAVEKGLVFDVQSV